jgi:hypothetical protein
VKKTFYGHGVDAITFNVILAIASPVHAAMFVYWMNTITSPWFLGLYAWFVLMFYPNPTYLFLEIKHLLFEDGVADDRPLGAIVSFGGMSIAGLALQVTSIVIYVQGVPLFTSHFEISILLLSFLAALGGCFGLLDIASPQGMLFPWLIIKLIYQVVTRKKLIVLTFGLTLLLAALTFLVFQFK